MRTDQYIGLSQGGKKLVKDMIPKLVCHFDGAFGNSFPLYSYEDKYCEFIQAEPWSSGPMFFIALQNNKDGSIIKESLWSEEEIEQYL
jgi:hypothetical protein